MELLSKIIVPIDGSEASERAVPVAVALAATTGASITLVMVAVHDSHIERAQRILRRAAGPIPYSVDTEVLIGQPVGRVLLAYVRPDRDAVVVMSTHARFAVGELLLGSVADEVVRHCAVPVVLVGPDAELPPMGGTYHELVACVDGEPFAERLMPIVQRLQRAGVHPWLFEVIAEAALPADTPAGDVIESGYVRRVAMGLRRDGVAADWDVGHDDDVARAIVRFAGERAASLIALATHGREPVERLAAASVTVTVARSAPCPVLVLGPEYAAAPVSVT